MDLTLIFLDFLGTSAFAIAGAYRGIKSKMDLLGVVIAGTITAVGGGTIRDVFIFNQSPFWVEQVPYLFVAVASALLTFLIPTHFARHYSPYRFLDAVGLGIFMSLGVLKGLEYGLNPFIALLAGLSPAIGGGILRGIMLGETPPYVLRAGFYATPAILGGILFIVLHYAGLEPIYNVFFSSAVILFLRIYGSMKKWKLPKSKY